MLPISHLESALTQTLNTPVRVLGSGSVGGGSINQTFKLETSVGQFFLKQNSAGRFPGMFAAEMKGLNLLAENSEFIIPRPISHLEYGGQQFLVMEWVETGVPLPHSYQNIGRMLAGLHRCSATSFGLDHDNYIGSLPQSNKQHASWAEFYWTERLLPQFKLAEVSGLSSALKEGFDRLEGKLDSLFPSEPPSLIHGDLWSGNYMITAEGPSIFDPAVYYGHREMDLAMMKLFGGFPAEVFEAYNEAFPLEAGWDDRIPFGQLYPLMVHVNLFGRSYVSQVQQILSRV